MEMTVEQLIKQAIGAHQAGKLEDAERLYLTILQMQPNHPDANHNLGVLKLSLGRSEAALPLFRIALETNPEFGQFWVSYINALIKEKQFSHAQDVLEKGERLGLARDAVDALALQLTLINQGQKYATTEKKRNDTAAEIQAPSKIELNSLLAHYQNERYDEAEKLAISITQKFPRHPFGWKTLGLVFLKKGKMQASLVAHEKAVGLAPGDAEAHNNLGSTLTELYQLENAEVAYRTAITLKPDYPEAHHNLGVNLQKLGRLQDAASSWRQSIALKPDYADAHNNLGSALKELGESKEAEASYRRAISLRPDYADAHNNLGVALNERGELKEAEASYRRAIALKLDYADAHNNLGSALKELGESKEAEASYRRAIALKPDYAEAHNNLGVALKEVGKLKEAEASYRRAIALKPDYAEAHNNLSSLVHYQKDDPQIAQVMKLLTGSNLTTKNHVALHFAAGKMFEDTNQIALAFEHYSKGNRFRKTLIPYDIETDRSLFAKIKGAFALAPSSRPLANNRPTTKHPVFIVGMPRSGTSLVEQILASHSMLHGAGELNLLAKGIQQAQCLSNRGNEAGQILRATYLAGIEELGVAEPYISDKMPINFRWIGFILDALPEAKIIHTRRDPLAIIWSIFRINFSTDGNAYANSLEDLVAYYQLYEDLMGFWHAKFPGQIYDIQYETLTKNQEAESRKLLKFVGLDWEEQCLAFHETKRAVATASAAQVRKPMYQGSSKEWERFKEYLLPIAGVLLDADSNPSKKLIPDAE